MQWKDTDLDYTKNCVFIEESGFHINMRNDWARSAIGTSAIVELSKTRSPFHIIIGTVFENVGIAEISIWYGITNGFM